jgi:hypothetical protein
MALLGGENFFHGKKVLPFPYSTLSKKAGHFAGKTPPQ